MTGCGRAEWVFLGALHSALTAKDFLPHSANHKSVFQPLAAVEVPNSQGRKYGLCFLITAPVSAKQLGPWELHHRLQGDQD